MLKILRRFLKRDDGVVAIEFALLAMPLIVMIFGIIETSLFFASSSLLESGAEDAARAIRTGQVQQSSNPQATFASLLCAEVDMLIDCTQLQYQVVAIPNDQFASAPSLQPTFNSSGQMVPAPFNAGKSDTVVMVTVYYQWYFLTPLIAPLMTGSLSQGWMGEESTVVIETEPYCTSLQGAC